MNMLDFENQMKNDIENIFTEILKKFNYELPISANSRAGAEISDFLENEFVEYLTNNPHKNISNPLSAPKENTKNPYDIAWDYSYNDGNETHSEFVWGDIKAIKLSYDDSNPDLGTPEKIIKFMLSGNFYLVFILVKYESNSNGGITFIELENNQYAEVTFLKDIHNSVRINPKPQFQVNINSPTEYRTQEEFINLFEKKYEESLKRIEESLDKKRKKNKERFQKIRELHSLKTNK